MSATTSTKPTGEGKKNGTANVENLKEIFQIFQMLNLTECAVADFVTPPTVVIAPARPGPWPRGGTFGRISPDCVHLLTLEALDSCHLNLRLQNRGEGPAHAVLQLGAATLPLGEVQPLQIQSYLLKKHDSGLWKRSLKEDHGPIAPLADTLSRLSADIQPV